MATGITTSLTDADLHARFWAGTKEMQAVVESVVKALDADLRSCGVWDITSPHHYWEATMSMDIPPRCMERGMLNQIERRVRSAYECRFRVLMVTTSLKEEKYSPSNHMCVTLQLKQCTPGGPGEEK